MLHNQENRCPSDRGHSTHRLSIEVDGVTAQDNPTALDPNAQPLHSLVTLSALG